MNEIISLLSTRRSVPPHLLGGPGPDQAELDTMLRIASRVPDHGRLVPWRFLVTQGEARDRLGEVIATVFQADEPKAAPERVAQERSRLSRAPLVVGVVARPVLHVKIPEWEQVLSAGAVCMNLSVAANALGYGAQWVTGWAAYEPRALAILGLEPNEKLAGFIHIGTPTDRLPDRPRPALSDIVARWGA